MYHTNLLVIGSALGLDGELVDDLNGEVASVVGLQSKVVCDDAMTGRVDVQDGQGGGLGDQVAVDLSLEEVKIN